MVDPAARETDEIIAEIEERLKVEYGQATREIQEKLYDYVRRREIKDQKWIEWVKTGKKTEQEYNDWLKGQLAMGQRWEEMRDSLAQDLANTSQIAQSIALGYMPEVYALNHDYGTFQVEKGSRVDTSYTLYSREAAERLMRDDPEMLPGPGKKVSAAIARGEAVRWNKQRLQSVMMQGILQGNSIPDIATRLQNAVGAVGESERKAAVRNARTMATYAQNAGRIDSYKRAMSLGLYVQKQWMAALDMRTRHEHRQLDGQIRDVDKPFENDLGSIMEPGDPNASPGNVWNCRCTLVAVVDNEKSDLTDPSLRPYNKLGSMSYKEWKESKIEKTQPILRPEEKSDSIRRKYIHEYRGHGGPTGTGRNQNLNIDYVPKETQGAGNEAPEVKKPVTWADKIGEIRNRIEQNGGTMQEADIMEAGKIFVTEYETVKAPYYEAMVKAKKDYEDFLEESGYNEYYKKYVDFTTKHGSKIMPPDVEEAAQKWFELEVSSKKVELQEKMKAAQEDYYGTPMGRAGWLKDKLSEVRSMGADGVDLKAHLNNSRSSARRIVEMAYNYYPTDWVNDSVARGILKPGKVDRGYYNDWAKEIKISGRSDESMLETAIHELGHRFERSVPGMRDAEKEFYERRTAGEELTWLGLGYAKTEKTRKDDFIHPYMGKDYRGQAYELVSMGFQYAYMEPAKLSEDKDMEAWIYGLLCLR